MYLLFPHSGGYSNSFETRMLKDRVVSPLWGLFQKIQPYMEKQVSCFPVTGVIPSRAVSEKLRPGCFPVMGVILKMLIHVNEYRKLLLRYGGYSVKASRGMTIVKGCFPVMGAILMATNFAKCPCNRSLYGL